MGWITSLHEPQCNNLKWASFCFIAPNKWGFFFSSAWAVLTGLECLHVMLYRMCPRIAWVTQHTCSVLFLFCLFCLFFPRWGRRCGGESTVIYDSQSRGEVVVVGGRRPFILPQRWTDDPPLRTRHTKSKAKDASRMLPRKNNPMVFFYWRILRS